MRLRFPQADPPFFSLPASPARPAGRISNADTQEADMKDWAKIRRINKARAVRKQAAEQAKPEWERKWEARELARAHGYIPYVCDEVAAYRF
jgi:hypothetical protein